MREKDGSRRKVLQEFSKKEYEHFLFWSKHVHRRNFIPKVSQTYLHILILLRSLLGLTFTLKFLERHEKKTILEYRRVADKLAPEDRIHLESIIKEEEEHERFFVSQIDEPHVRYMGFIVLGLADAIVEITGVHSGFLGVTSSTLVAGVAGLVVGFAAAIAMASAAFLQARNEGSKSPGISSISTGTAYFLAVGLLAFPYFLTDIMPYAFGGSLAFAILLIAAFTYYGVIIRDRTFLPEFVTGILLILGTAVASFFFGSMIGDYFGVSGFFG